MKPAFDTTVDYISISDEILNVFRSLILERFLIASRTVFGLPRPRRQTRYGYTNLKFFKNNSMITASAIKYLISLT